MNWLVLVILPLSIAPIGVLVFWWRRGKRDEERRAEAVTKMNRYVRGRAVAQLPRGPLHALADGQAPPVPLPRRTPRPQVPALATITTPLRRPPVRQSPEPALSMITPAPRRR